jgi:hypothetical protein
METKQKLTQHLYDCERACITCRDACLREPALDKLKVCMMLDKECAGICQLTATLLESSSLNTERFLKLCGEICEACAEECEKHPYDHCVQCAKACRECAKMCFEQVMA